MLLFVSSKIRSQLCSFSALFMSDEYGNHSDFACPSCTSGKFLTCCHWRAPIKSRSLSHWYWLCCGLLFLSWSLALLCFVILNSPVHYTQYGLIAAVRAVQIGALNYSCGIKPVVGETSQGASWCLKQPWQIYDSSQNYLKAMLCFENSCCRDRSADAAQ